MDGSTPGKSSGTSGTSTSSTVADVNDDSGEEDYAEEDYGDAGGDDYAEEDYGDAGGDDYAEEDYGDEDGEYMQALWSYDAAEDGEISFAEGEQLFVIDKDESGWWTARNEAGDQGFFPSGYVT